MPRTYRSAVREQATASTRAAILDTAEALFAEHGYPRVTIARIAQEAGVAQGTVYASFGNKLALVRGLTERAAEDDRISSALSAIAKASDGGEIAGLAARSTGDVVRRHGRLMAVLVNNAAADTEIGEIFAGTNRLLRERFRLIAARLAAVGALRPGMTTARATDVLMYYLSPESWLRLRGLGWGWPACQDWLRRELLFALCGDLDDVADESPRADSMK
ncbi:TetR/AcrR family transcriptional regulator [Promicromonospora sp. NPDC060271]|uniref:TetR/AcrR family transcriptional regulator n=1 Tax=Promicromonospora sp. NPDC060271 TaxID=3347089 RepID=UPI00365EA600